MKEKINKILIDVFNLDANVDIAHLEYNVSPGWDSVGHMALVVKLEQEFDCMLEMEDVLNMSSYSKIIEIMSKHV